MKRFFHHLIGLLACTINFATIPLNGLVEGLENLEAKLK